MDIPLVGSSLLFWNVAFLKPGKPSEQGREPTMFNSTHMWSQNQTHIWVGGERSHHRTIPVSLNWSGKISSYAKNCTETLPWTRVSMDGELVEVTKLLLSVVFADVLAALVINTRYQGVYLRGLKSDAYLPVLFHWRCTAIKVNFDENNPFCGDRAISNHASSGI